MTQSPAAPDTQTELAKERNRIAADRTLLTWIRTSVSFIGLGFGIEQILTTLEVKVQSRLAATFPPLLLGAILIGLGVFTVVVAALDYQGELGRFQQSDYCYRSRPSLGLIVSSVVIILAIILFGLIWSQPPLG
jgi:putative membrane protein